jgi:hypothetical protein
VIHVPNKAGAMNAWCRCGKSIKQSTSSCDDEESPSIQRKASTSSVSTLSIRESHTDCTDITYRKPMKCQGCLNAEARNKHHMSSTYNTDHDFRPPDEILVNRRDLPPRPQKYAIPTTKESSLHGVDKVQRHKAQSPVAEIVTLIPTRKESREDAVSLTRMHDLYHPQNETRTCSADSATTNRFPPNSDPNEAVLSPRVDNFEEDDLMIKIPSDDTESSGAMWPMAVMDIDQVPSDERAGEELEKALGGRTGQIPSQQQAVAKTGANHRDVVCDLDLSPSDEGNLASKALPYTRIHVGRLLINERDQHETVRSFENLNSPPPRHDDESHRHTADIAGDNDLTNVDNVGHVAAGAHFGWADSADECEPSRPQLPVGDPMTNEPNKPSVTKKTATKVDSPLLDGVPVSPESIQVGFEAEQHIIDKCTSSLNPFSWLCAA